MTVRGGTPVERAYEGTGAVPGTASSGGPEGNERLTAVTGAVLLVLFAVEGVTLLFLRQLLTVHFFVGLLLIGPVCLKIASTGYRFLRYYTGAPAYRRKGPPMRLLRVLGPLVVVTSAAVLATGVALALRGPGAVLGPVPVPVLFLHKASFVCWVTVTAVHVLAYVWRLPRLVGAELRVRPGARPAARHAPAAPVPAAPWRAARWALLTAALGGGLAVAFAGVHLAAGWRG